MQYFVTQQYIAIRNISICFITHIVLYCDRKYYNISIYRYIVAPLSRTHDTYDVIQFILMHKISEILHKKQLGCKITVRP